MSDQLGKEFAELVAQKEAFQREARAQDATSTRQLWEARNQHQAVLQSIEVRLVRLIDATPNLRSVFSHEEKRILSFTSYGLRFGSQTFDRNDIHVGYWLTIVPGYYGVSLREEAMWQYCNTSCALALGSKTQLENLPTEPPPEILNKLTALMPSAYGGFRQSQYIALILQAYGSAKQLLDDKYLALQVFRIAEGIN